MVDDVFIKSGTDLRETDHLKFEATFVLLHRMSQPAAIKHQGAGPLRETENFDGDDVVTSIIDKLSALSPDSQISNYGKNCIYHVPRKNADENEADYVPRIVSIGFIHHGKSQLEDMQAYKLKCLDHFRHSFGVTIGQLVEFTRVQEKLVCECYEDIVFRNLSEKYKVKVKPCEVILLDGIFIIVLFLKNHGFVGMRDGNDVDTILSNPWILNNLLHDLLLFENQLPLKFLKALYNTFVSNKFADGSAPAFDGIVHEYFKNVFSTENLVLVPDVCNARHFVEFLSILHKPDEKSGKQSVGQRIGGKMDSIVFPTAQGLEAAGVKLLHGIGEMNVWFDVDKGVLNLSQLNLNHSTVTFLRNLLAFEQSGCRSRHITSYVILLSFLIQDKKDVDLLIEKHIIKNGLESHGQVLEFFRGYREIGLGAEAEEFHFAHEVYNHLGSYARGYFDGWQYRFSRYKNTLQRDYFNTPWDTANIMFVFLGLYISLIQTVFSVLQYTHPGK